MTHLQGRDHLDAPPRCLPVDFVLLAGQSVELGLVRAVDVVDEPRHEFLGHLDQVVHIGVPKFVSTVVELFSAYLRHIKLQCLKTVSYFEQNQRPQGLTVNSGL